MKKVGNWFRERMTVTWYFSHKKNQEVEWIRPESRLFLCNEELLPALKSLMTYGALTYAGWHDPQATHDGAHITHNASDLIFKTGHPSGNYNQKLRKNTLNKISSNGDRTEVKSKVL